MKIQISNEYFNKVEPLLVLLYKLNVKHHVVHANIYSITLGDYTILTVAE